MTSFSVLLATFYYFNSDAYFNVPNNLLILFTLLCFLIKTSLIMKEKLRKHNYKYEEFKSQLGSKRSCPICKSRSHNIWNKYLFFKTIECRKCGMTI